MAFPREVTRRERCIGLPPDISGISGTVTGPSHSPARVFMVAKDFCAADRTGATEDFCASDCAKATGESISRVMESTKERDFIFHSPRTAYFSFCSQTKVIGWWCFQLQNDKFQ